MPKEPKFTDEQKYEIALGAALDPDLGPDSAAFLQSLWVVCFVLASLLAGRGLFRLRRRRLTGQW